MNKKIIVLILILTFTYNLKGQIQLLNVKPSECDHSCEFNKRIYDQTWLNDSILQIRTTASANCIGVHNPRLKMYGPILELEFDEFMIDSTVNPKTGKKDFMVAYDCICVFQITWDIKGLNKKDEYILLLNGRHSSDFKGNEVNELLRNYQIINRNLNYDSLTNRIDKDGLTQDIQTFEKNNATTIKVYTVEKKQTNR